MASFPFGICRRIGNARYGRSKVADHGGLARIPAVDAVSLETTVESWFEVVVMERNRKIAEY
jgi:hypothetical protein